MKAADEAHLRAALALGRRALGETWPNPSVGCVVVAADGRVAGRGRTAPAGRPHAETEALRMAGVAARGGTAYVTLEPCAHWGMTPPCAAALIEAGIVRVVGGASDPDPRVDGRGFDQLRAGGVAVETGNLALETAALAAGFVSRVTRGRPRVTLKMAASLDGRIATARGESRWITGPEARRMVQGERARHDAVMVGIGTALADDPLLTVRLDGARVRPLVRIVADRTLRLSPRSRLALGAAEAPVWIVYGPEADDARAASLDAQGVRLLRTDGTAGGALSALGDAGLNTVLVEGGGRLAAALLRDALVDEILWFAAPVLLGADGQAAIGPLGLDRLADALHLRTVDSATAAHDVSVRLDATGEN